MSETRSGRAIPIDTNKGNIISLIKGKFDERKLMPLEVEKAMKKHK